jgi:FkbM family methyltransferase
MIDQFFSLAGRGRAKIRRLLSISAPRLSYSQAGEDLIVSFVFDALGIRNPSYLDIGAYHPKHLSNTYLFYKNGSSGVCIEPDPDLYARYKGRRPRDTCLNVGVGVSNETSADFYVLATKTLNTFSRVEAEKCDANGQKIEKVISIPLVKIDNILSTHFRNSAPNLVSLDIEGLDYEVIKTFDFSKARPEVFCIETITFSENNSEEKVAPIIEYMKANDYMVYADSYINTIFVDRLKWRNR